MPHLSPQFATRSAGRVASAWPNWAACLKRELPIRGRSAAQAAGLRYERKVFRKLEKGFPGFISHLPFTFTSPRGREVAIPDGVIFGTEGPGKPARLTIIEVKLRHTVDAWYQLHQLYLPVVAEAFPGFRIKVLEICKWYDPSVKLPGNFEIVRDLEGYEVREVSKYGVWVFTDR